MKKFGVSEVKVKVGPSLEANLELLRIEQPAPGDDIDGMAAIAAAAREAGLKCQLGAQVGETGILSAADRHVATRCADILWREGSYGKLLLEQDIVEPDITVGSEGRAGALEAPGLGVRPVADLRDSCITDRFRIDR